MKGLYGKTLIGGEKVMVMKPLTYMNLSGQAVKAYVDYYKLDPASDLIVMYDYIDLEFGQIRIRKQGSAGSHNGMKSVIYQLQSDAFPRVRIGIGSSAAGDWKDYVTGQVTEQEAKVLAETIREAAAALDCIITDGIDIAMNRFNTSRKHEEE